MIINPKRKKRRTLMAFAHLHRIPNTPLDGANRIGLPVAA